MQSNAMLSQFLGFALIGFPEIESMLVCEYTCLAMYGQGHCCSEKFFWTRPRDTTYRMLLGWGYRLGTTSMIHIHAWESRWREFNSMCFLVLKRIYHTLFFIQKFWPVNEHSMQEKIITVAVICHFASTVNDYGVNPCIIYHPRFTWTWSNSRQFHTSKLQSWVFLSICVI